MNEERKKILDMVKNGKISVEEGDTLLEALMARSQKTDESKAFDTKEKDPKYLFVKVASTVNDTVDVKIPLNLIRAGIKLTALIPQQAITKINASMAERGMSYDLNALKAQDFEELIKSLCEMEVVVDQKNGDKIRVYCA